MKYLVAKFINGASTNIEEKEKKCNTIFFSYFEKKQRFKKVADDGEIDWQVFEMMFKRQNYQSRDFNISHHI